MRILAIDPGSSLGWATDATGRLEFGTEDFHIKNGESSGNRWRRFGEWLVAASGTRAENVTGENRWAYDPIDLIVYEKAMFHPKSRLAAEIAAGFTTRLEEHCERHGIALQPVAVQTLKAFALPKVKRKNGDPKMDRSKSAMIAAAITMLNPFGLSAPVIFPKPGDKSIADVTEHEADALWLYWWAKENCK